MTKKQNESLRNFARHCHLFYLTSLSQSGSVKASIASNGKVVIEVFDKICAISAAINDNHTTLQEGLIVQLKNEHDLCAKDHHELLMECGLLEIDQFTTLDNATELLELYNEARHEARRHAHQSAMVHRQNSFLEMLSQAEKQCLDDEADHPCTMPSTGRSIHTSTTMAGIKATISTTEKFVAKYKSMIGSHSFLAGLHKFIHLQLKPTPESSNRKCDPYYVVQWEFRGSVLTEACMPISTDGDELSYARDALNFLFHFLIMSKKIDIEGGSAEDGAEPTVSFEINKHVSNATLCRILNVLPSPTSLDARATGTLSLLNKSNGERVAARLNVDGHLDEPWPLFHNIFFADYCTLL